MAKATLRIWRGDSATGGFEEYGSDYDEGMVVLDVVHKIQAEQAPDMACRWNCKAGKCGSCSAEINGNPRLMCMTRMSSLDTDREITVEPLKTFPLVRDLVTDVSWNYRVKETIAPLSTRAPDNADGTWTIQQPDVERSHEFRKCIECFLCQDVCHVLREHRLHEEFVGPRFFVHAAGLEMSPIDEAERLKALKDEHGIGFCNITKCCTKVCPEEIAITDNAIIPLKERIVDRFYDPLKKLFNGKT